VYGTMINRQTEHTFRGTGGQRVSVCALKIKV